MIDEAIAAVGMTGMAARGKVMGMLKPKLTGRADMGQVSGMIKKKLMGLFLTLVKALSKKEFSAKRTESSFFF